MWTLETVKTAPFAGQKPGTSGLRKKVKVFQNGYYLHNFVQSIFDSLPESHLKGCTMVVSGDGRYWNKSAIQIIVKMAAANGIGRVWIGQGGLLSTPAVSAVIREREGGCAYGGIILTASHNPGGPDNDFGIKYNCENGGPAPESVTDAIYKRTTEITEFKIAKGIPDIDINVLGKVSFGSFCVEIIDSTADHVNLLKSLFDFPSLRSFCGRSDVTILCDAMAGVGGITVQRLFRDEIGLTGEFANCEPKEDFGGGHPDPNLVYAHDLVNRMGLGSHQPANEPPMLGFAFDGDADRNMILGKRFFVSPSDSVAVIAENAQSIPYFAKKGFRGMARSMPTSGALDHVAKAANGSLAIFETPTGWKFFGNLMDAGRISLCGEESFGTGSDHIREKDGAWTVLAWLSILSDRNKDVPVGGKLVTVEDIVVEFWKKHGRNYYTRYDYEEVSGDSANAMMNYLISMFGEWNKGGTSFNGFTISNALEFCYTDPVDGSVSNHQGIIIKFVDGSRVVFRLSGTGSVGATVRMYIERYDRQDVVAASATALAPLVAASLELARIQEFTGRNSPTVIT